MNTKTLVFLALFVGIGAVLHAVVPPILGMKPDLALVMMFLGIMLFPKKENVFLISVATGVISAITTGFPGGQIPNLVDKPITGFAFFFLFLGLTKVVSTLTKYKILNKVGTVFNAGLLTAMGTLISGTIFLGTALLLVGLPGGATFSILFLTVVLPTTAVNTALMVLIYPIALNVAKRSNLTIAA